MNWVEFTLRLLPKRYFPGRSLFLETAYRMFPPPSVRVTGEIAGYRCSLNLQDLMQRQVCFRTYEPRELAWLSRRLQPGEVFLDVGANIGVYTLNAARLVGENGRVHAFEPMPEPFQVLHQAVKENNLSHVTANQLAVSNREGDLALYQPDDHRHNSGWVSAIPNPGRPHQVNVPAVTLQAYARQKGISHIDLIKLDIEGGELEALQGTGELLEGEAAPDLLVEVNPFLLSQRGLSSNALTGYLAGRGYWQYVVGSRLHGPIQPDRQIGRLVNLYCTKKSTRGEA